MKNYLILVAVILVSLVGCGDKEKKTTAPLTTEIDTPPQPQEPDEIPAMEEMDDLDTLAKPAPVKLPKVGSLERFFVDSVKELMVNGTKNFDVKVATKKVLNELEVLGLTQQGRPEGLVRDIIVRMVEDMEAFRPPNFTAEKLDKIAMVMLKNLGKSYLVDLKESINPSGKKHNGKQRRITAIDPKAVKAGHTALTWNQIGGFKFDESKPLPQSIQDLDGKKVAIVGFLYPLREHEDIHEFLLVESMWTCCFGEPPQVTQTAKINLDPKKPGIWVMTTPIIIHGTFHVQVEKDEGWVIGVYRLSADTVVEYKP